MAGTKSQYDQSHDINGGQVNDGPVQREEEEGARMEQMYHTFTQEVVWSNIIIRSNINGLELT